VLAMLFSVPLFTPTTYIEEPNSYDFGLSLIYQIGPETEAGKKVFDDTVRIQSAILETPLIRLYVNANKTIEVKSEDGTVIDTKPVIIEWANEDIDLSLLRDTEKDITSLTDIPGDQIYLAVYDIR